MNPPTPKEQIEALQSELIQLRKRGDRTESRQDNRHAESEMLGKLGIAYYQDQEWHSAIATLTEYLNLARELGNQTNEAVAHYYLGFTQQAIAEFEQAVAAFFQGYRLFRQLQQHEFAAQLWQQLVQQGQRYLQNQQVPEAVALYKRQIQVLLEFDDLKASAEIAVELGKVYYSQPDFPEAIGCFTSALDTAQTLKDQTLENVALAWLGCSHWQGGDLSQGLQYLEQRLALVQQLENTAAQQETLTWLIQICQQLDHPDKLIQSYQLQANFWQQQGEPVNQHLSLYELAIYQFNRQQYPEALSGFQVALELANTLNDDQGKSWKTANDNYMLGECYRNLGENQAATSPYQQAVELYLQLGAKEWAEKGLGHLLNLYRELQQAEQEIDCQKKRFQLIQDRGDNITAYSLAYGIGNLYNHRQQFTQALEYYQEALILAKNLEPQQNLANAAYMVADCYRNLGQQQAAISGYEQAVGLYVEVNETKWALSGLGYLVNLYRELKQDEQVIASYQRRLEIFRELGDRTAEQSCLYELARFQFNTQKYQDALSGFETALQIAEFLDEGSDRTYRIANSRYMLARCHEKLEQFHKAIENYQLSSQLYQEVNDIKWMANASHLVANIYFYNYPIEKAESIEQAIAIFQDNLIAYSRETYPQDWAKTQNALGNAYRDRILGYKAGNLEIAIRHYEAALEAYTREAYPEDWAMVQVNLGGTYRNRIEGEKLENWHRAISCYEAALEVRTREADPEKWASLQNRLGHIYSDDVPGNKAENLETAIRYYEAALEVYTREAYPEGLARTQNSLGITYENRLCGEKLENLEKAIHCYKQAANLYASCRIYKWAGINQQNLANLYCEIKKYVNSIELKIILLKNAFKYYDTALNNFEYLRAESDKIDKDKRTINEEYNPLYIGIINVSLELGNYTAAFEYADRSKARNLTELIAIRNAYPEGVIPEVDRQHLLQIRREIDEISRHIEKTQNAIKDPIFETELPPIPKITPNPKATSNVIDIDDTIAVDLPELTPPNSPTSIDYNELSSFQAVQIQKRHQGIERQQSVQQDIIAEAQLNKEKTDTFDFDRNQPCYDSHQRKNENNLEENYINYRRINQLRKELYEKSPYKPLNYSQIQALLDEETAILEWYILPDNFLAFSLTNQTLNLWKSSTEDLDNLFDWTDAYLHDYRNNKTQWHNNLPQRLETLAQILHLDEILHNLREKFPNCKKLILIPHRFLHLFPLHALPVPVIATNGVGAQCLRPISRQNGNQEGLHIAPLQELFPKGVAYAPNCQVLQQAQNRQRPDFNQLFAIQNPTQDLDFTDIEVAAIQSLFNPHHILQYDAAEKAAILEGDNLKNAHCTHFSCHGYFNFEDALKSALLLAKSEFTPPPPSEDQSRYIPLQNGNLLDLGKCLTIEDILRLDLTNCRLVTLSACETGITDFNSTSDEYIGLPSGFILAGAPNVVCSLWAVNDLSTALLMIRFYQNVKNGETVPLALKQAQIWLRDVTVEGLQVWSSQLMLRSTYRGQFRRRFSKMEGTAKPFASPYYWAGFCAIGA